MTTIAERVGAVEEKVDRLDRLEAAVDHYVREGARQRAADREEAERRRKEFERQLVADREEAERQRAADREKAERRRKEFERQLVADREEAERQRAADREEFERQLVADREKAERERRETNRKWGEASDRIGRFVEDIVAPSVRRMAHEVFECGGELFFSDRVSRARAGDRARMREFDALYIGTEKVLLNETKSTPRDEDIRRFARFVHDRELDHYFPECRAMPVVAVFSSLRMPEAMVHYLTREGIYALAVGDELMDVLNLDAVRRRERRRRRTGAD